jgi:hypothetical protein
VVLVTFNSRYLASAPKVRWRARAGALGQGPRLPPQLAHTTTSSLKGFEASSQLFKSNSSVLRNSRHIACHVSQDMGPGIAGHEQNTGMLFLRASAASVEFTIEWQVSTELALYDTRAWEIGTSQLFGPVS